MFLGHFAEVHPLDVSGVGDHHIEVSALLADHLDQIVEIVGDPEMTALTCPGMDAWAASSASFFRPVM
jgi:hypothetical protein